MVVCIECGAAVAMQRKYQQNCLVCKRKTDKYDEVSHTYKILDLLLLKESVFRHFLINKQIASGAWALLLVLHVVSIFSIQLADLQVKPFILQTSHPVEVDLFFSSAIPHLLIFVLHAIFLKIGLGGIRFSVIVKSLLFSSFYSFFKMAFALWKYTHAQYFIIVEILSCSGTIVAFHCLGEHFQKALSVVCTAKLLSVAIVSYFYEEFKSHRI